MLIKVRCIMCIGIIMIFFVGVTDLRCGRMRESKGDNFVVVIVVIIFRKWGS